MRNVFKKEDGITLITLTVAVTILIIITSLLIYNAKNGIRMRNLKMMQNDIKLLDDKIDAYYMKYGKLPMEIRYQGNIHFTPGENDNDIYYVIDLKPLEGLSLNYGDDFSKINSEDDTLTYDDIYIINEQSHHIYYARGIEMDGILYYTNDTDEKIKFMKKWKEVIDETGNKLITNGEVHIILGDYISYNSTDGVEEITYTSENTKNGYNSQTFSSSYTGGWRVLGVNDYGQILIVPDKVIKTTSNEYYYLKGKEGYTNVVSELNKISEIYGHGYGAVGARSITVEDVNKITGYNPNNVGIYDVQQKGNGTKYEEGNILEYGEDVTYSWKGDEYPYYSSTNGLSENLISMHNREDGEYGFNWFDGDTRTWKLSAQSTTATTTNREKIVTLKSNYYWYFLNSLTTSNREGEGLVAGSKEYTTIYNGTGEEYWLASYYIGTGDKGVNYGIRYICNDYVGGHAVYYSYGYPYSNYSGVRPVVLLKTNIQLIGSSEDGWTIVKE